MTTDGNSINPKRDLRAKPFVNVTPLIDVLLVVLIIFMVMSPLKPHRFLAKVPSKPDLDVPVHPNIDTLVVTIKPDLSLMLNGMTDMGSVYDTSKLSATLSDLFQQRLRNRDFAYELRDRRQPGGFADRRLELAIWSAVAIPIYRETPLLISGNCNQSAVAASLCRRTPKAAPGSARMLAQLASL
jgi:biopolymer transport protein ExbD